MFTTNRLVVGLLLAASTAVVLLALAWWLGPPPNTLGYEFAKALLQLLVVTVIGTAASLAASNYQHDRDHRRELQDRSDQLMRSLRDDALRNYHQVKRARRLLRARLPVPGTVDLISLTSYDDQLEAIIDAQLDFERLVALSGNMSDRRIDASTLKERLDHIEKYLGQLITEYERKRPTISGDLPQGSHELDVLEDFKGRDKQPFREGIADPLHLVVGQLQSALLRPLDA